MGNSEKLPFGMPDEKGEKFGGGFPGYLFAIFISTLFIICICVLTGMAAGNIADDKYPALSAEIDRAVYFIATVIAP